MQKKVTKSVSEIVAAFQVIRLLFEQSRIPIKQSYWLKRNHDHLKPIFNRWLQRADKIRMDFISSLPSSPKGFIPPDKCQEFIEKIEQAPDEMFNKPFVLGVIESFMVYPPKGMTQIQKKEMIDIINKEADETMEEIEFWVLDSTGFETAFLELPSSAYIALEFMMEEPSGIVIAKANTILQ